MRTLQELLASLSILVKEINDLDHVIQNHVDLRVKEDYKKKFREKVDEYMTLCKSIKVKLEETIETERKEGKPENFTYWTIKKKLNEVLGAR